MRTGYRTCFHTYDEKKGASCYNMKADDITIHTKMAVEVVEFCCLLLYQKEETNESTKILIVFNLEVLITA